jgi:ATP-dependent DNA ligase
MGLAIPLSLEPMEAQSVDDLPSGAGWQFEPKWDGFRALAFRDGDKVFLQSRNQRPLGRYFPELIRALGSLPIPRFVLDGEIIIRNQPFDELQLRLHPAASRIADLAETQPATFVAFDLLANRRGDSLLDLPLSKRRKALDSFFKSFPKNGFILKSRSMRSQAQPSNGSRAEGTASTVLWPSDWTSPIVPANGRC